MLLTELYKPGKAPSVRQQIFADLITFFIILALRPHGNSVLGALKLLQTGSRVVSQQHRNIVM